jgi:hypothetical protein
MTGRYSFWFLAGVFDTFVRYTQPPGSVWVMFSPLIIVLSAYYIKD